ncbi:MAG: hypothetical protein JOZ15_00160, partial [Acidobacteria bacterium]|nr:hypothetical protein [Acidobacteriota bacterium]
MDDDLGVAVSAPTGAPRRPRGPRRLAAAWPLAWMAAIGGWALAAGPLAAQHVRFYPVAPCRLIDTRGLAGPLNGPPLTSGPPRAFDAGGQCGISTRATAVTARLTAVRAQTSGYLAFGPAGGPPPVIATLRFRAGQVHAKEATLQLGAAGAFEVAAQLAAGSVSLLMDVEGYYADPSLERTTTAPPAFNPPPGKLDGRQQVQ